MAYILTLYVLWLWTQVSVKAGSMQTLQQVMIDRKSSKNKFEFVGRGRAEPWVSRMVGCNCRWEYEIGVGSCTIKRKACFPNTSTQLKMQTLVIVTYSEAIATCFKCSLSRGSNKLLSQHWFWFGEHPTSSKPSAVMVVVYVSKLITSNQ